MTLVKINALEIPPQAGEAGAEELVKRFTARLDSLSDVAGFEGFELLRPTGENETRWFVYTRWLDQSSYEAWRDGDGARNSHAQQSDDKPGNQPGDRSAGDTPPQRPVSMGATLLEFEVAVSAGPSGV
ncbi:MAG: antibiotic biosynthesis monooxygenase family protein [Acidimicrobiales bacterium]